MEETERPCSVMMGLWGEVQEKSLGGLPTRGWESREGGVVRLRSPGKGEVDWALVMRASINTVAKAF